MNRYENWLGLEKPTAWATVATLRSTESVANALEAERLHLNPDAMVRRTQRKRLAGGLPYMIETSSVPTALFPLPEETSTRDFTILELAKICGVGAWRGT